MNTDKQIDKQNNDPYPPGRSNEGGRFNNPPNTGSSVSEGNRRSDLDPQNTSMGQGSQPASVNLNRGDEGPAKQDQSKSSQNAPAGQDDTGLGDDSNSNKAAGGA